MLCEISVDVPYPGHLPAQFFRVMRGMQQSLPSFEFQRPLRDCMPAAEYMR